ncbi:MAG: hypothetical protein Q9174_002638 [Haloplaca sp. 1 TL-2023]
MSTARAVHCPALAITMLANDPAIIRVRARQDVESAETPWRSIEGVTEPQTPDPLSIRSRVMLELYRAGAFQRQDQGPRQHESSSSTTPTQQYPGQAARIPQSSPMHPRQPSSLAPGSQQLSPSARSAYPSHGRGRGQPLNPQAQGLQPIPRHLYPLLIPQLAYTPPPHLFKGAQRTSRPTAPRLPLGRAYDTDFPSNPGPIPRPIEREEFGRSFFGWPTAPVRPVPRLRSPPLTYTQVHSNFGWQDHNRTIRGHPDRRSPPLTFEDFRQGGNAQGSGVSSYQQNSPSPAHSQPASGSLEDDLRRLRLAQQEERPSETEREQDDPAHGVGQEPQRGI